MDECVLPVGIALDGDRIPETATDDLGEASSALNALQADLDTAFYRAMDYEHEDYGNRACYELVIDDGVGGGCVIYYGLISNSHPATPLA